MKINNNIQALNAYRNLNNNQNAVSKNLEKLSSGLRINRAADDAAGLAISEKMRSQIRGLKQAERNAMDGISLIQTAEGAMQEIHSMLQRMRELAVQASNDTNTPEDRDQIQKEMSALRDEIDSISEKTEFNTKKLLDGSSSYYSRLIDDQNEANLLTAPVPENYLAESGKYELEVVSAPTEIEISNGDSNEKEIIELDSAKIQENNIHKLGEYTINIQVNEETNEKTITVYDPDGEEVSSQNGAYHGEARETGFVVRDIDDINEEVNLKVTLSAEVEVLLSKEETTESVTTSISDGGFIYKDGSFIFDEGKFSASHMEFHIDNNAKAGDTSTFEIANNEQAFQIGPNSEQQIQIAIPKMDAKELGLENIEVRTHQKAKEAISKIDEAIHKASDARANLGAVQNRLEHTITNLQVTHENLTSAESRIRDADMALEMTEFTRNNIINQSATAMLAQANQLPQGVLQLLQ
ncbi:flagellin N-terminal helical domain-containing protein [Alteribacillus iranensis]|uniref:Flagellin n=1 Tax=Alteribacillus iranensis TaxID=930128 RepID=A0A1I1ZJL1_9BACI|nr:flagellin [Alteribacillus iranensis]SFE31896.1 flagellin [Alteribacillus iranensis]